MKGYLNTKAAYMKEYLNQQVKWVNDIKRGNLRCPLEKRATLSYRLVTNQVLLNFLLVKVNRFRECIIVNISSKKKHGL